MPNIGKKSVPGALTVAGRIEPPAVILSLAGFLTVYSASEFRNRSHELIEAGAPNLVLELEKLAYLDSAGIGTILGIYKRMRGINGKLYLASPQATVRKILKMTGLDRFFNIVPDVSDALRKITATESGLDPELEDKLRSVLSGTAT